MKHLTKPGALSIDEGMLKPTPRPKDALSKKYRYAQCGICNQTYSIRRSSKSKPTWKNRCPEHDRGRVDKFEGIPFKD